jgi:hypothetical protein
MTAPNPIKLKLCQGTTRTASQTEAPLGMIQTWNPAFREHYAQNKWVRLKSGNMRGGLNELNCPLPTLRSLSHGLAGCDVRHGAVLSVAA